MQIRPESECRSDQLSLGEVMLRFDPSDRTMLTFKEVLELMKGVGARIAR